MAKYSENPNFQKCEPCQKKIAFKQAYQQVRTLLDISDSKYDRRLSAVCALVSQMPWKKSEAYLDALRAINSRQDKSFEEHPIAVRPWFRKESAVKFTGCKGKLTCL